MDYAPAAISQADIQRPYARLRDISRGPLIMRLPLQRCINGPRTAARLRLAIRVHHLHADSEASEILLDVLFLRTIPCPELRAEDLPGVSHEHRAEVVYAGDIGYW